MKQYLIIALSILIISCSKDDFYLIPSGVLTLENRTISSSFTKIDASDGFTINISQGGSVPLLIQADNNVIEYVETYVANGTLILKIKDGVRMARDKKNKTVNVTLSVDELNSIIATGGSKIQFSSALNQELLNITTSGGGSIFGSIHCSEMLLNLSGGAVANINGTCKTLNCNLSGGGNIHLFELMSDDIKIDISGGSTAELYANHSINVTSASGGSRIYYEGMAQVMTSNLTGGSTISKLRKFSPTH